MLRDAFTPYEPDDVTDAQAADDWARIYRELLSMLSQVEAETGCRDESGQVEEARTRLAWWTRRARELRLTPPIAPEPAGVESLFTIQQARTPACSRGADRAAARRGR